MQSIPHFFLNDQFFVDEKVRIFGIRNEYKVYNKDGEQIGFIKQIMSTSEKILHIFLGRAMMPFTFEIQDLEGNVLSVIKRDWTIWMSKISVITPDGTIIGYVQQKFTFLKPKFEILSTDGQKIAEIKGDFLAWNFSIVNTEEKEIGRITKKWSGMLQEAFTTADKYLVDVDQSLAEDTNKIAILTAAITIDMVFKEQQN